MRQLLIILFLAFTVQGFAQQIIFITITGGDLYSVNLALCAPFFIGSTGVGFADIARTPDGRLWGIGNSQLYQIDRFTARATPVGYTGLNNVSLVDLNDSVLLTESNKQLYGIRVSDASSYFIGNIGYQAAGDLTWYDKDLYMTSGDGFLVKMVLSDDYSSIISSAAVNSAANLIPTCEGAITASFSGEYNAIVGFAGGNAYKICPVDGSFQLLCSSMAPTDIPGAAALRIPVQKPLPVSCKPEAPSITISPNPATTWVTVQGDSIKYVYLIDDVGRKLTRNFELSSNTPGGVQIDVSALSAGIYFVITVDTKGNLSGKKLLVIRP